MMERRRRSRKKIKKMMMRMKRFCGGACGDKGVGCGVMVVVMRVMHSTLHRT